MYYNFDFLFMFLSRNAHVNIYSNNSNKNIVDTTLLKIHNKEMI